MRIVSYILLLLTLSVVVKAQDTAKVSLVYLEHSETLSFDEKRLPDAQILRGNVRFRHDSVLMYCDSAYFFEKENSLHAFGHVHMVQGDTLEGFGDFCHEGCPWGCDLQRATGDPCRQRFTGGIRPLQFLVQP